MVKQRGYGCGVDWWQFGILLYEMLFGTTPFKAGKADAYTIFQNIKESKDIKIPKTPQISKHAQDLLKKLLLVNSVSKYYNFIRILLHHTAIILFCMYLF